jgi:hypothetical protein
LCHIDFDLHAVGVLEEQLMQWKPGHGLLAKRDACLGQPRARGVEIGCGERDVIEVPSIIVRSVLPADQMQDGTIAQPEPRAGKVEWRTIAVDKSQRFGIEGARTREVTALNGDVIDSSEGHWHVL